MCQNAKWLIIWDNFKRVAWNWKRGRFDWPYNWTNIIAILSLQFTDVKKQLIDIPIFKHIILINIGWVDQLYLWLRKRMYTILKILSIWHKARGSSIQVRRHCFAIRGIGWYSIEFLSLLDLTRTPYNLMQLNIDVTIITLRNINYP